MGKKQTITLPDIGEGVVEGEVIEWLKKVGDNVAKDEPVVIVMTDKATVELPSPCQGRLAHCYYDVGGIAQKDKPLYDIEESIVGTGSVGTPACKSSVATPATEPEPCVASMTLKYKPAALPITAKPTAPSVAALPQLRKMAHNMGVDLEKVPGSGKDGRVTAADIRHYLSGNGGDSSAITVPPAVEGNVKPVVGIKRLMAVKMAQSKASIPHFSYFERVDVTRLIDMRLKFKEKALKEGIHLTFTPFFIRALSLTIKKYPIINASYDASSQTVAYHSHHNIGIAQSSPQGLIVPVFKEVEQYSLEELIRLFDALKKRSTNGSLTPDDMRGGTITLSNFGVFGSEGLFATPIINYPEAAILALAHIHKEPMVRNGAVVVRDVLNLSWSFDHRIIDGDTAAHLSLFFSTLLHNPAGLL